MLEGASIRLTTAATCPAKRGPDNRAHSAHSPTLKGRLGPKSTVFCVFRLDSARCKLAFTSSERRFHAFEELAPRLSGDKWGRGPKKPDESARENVRFGGRSLTILRFREYYNVIFKDHALTDELAIKATREVHALSVGARGHDQNCDFSPCLLGQKAWCGGLERGYHA